MLDLTLIDLAVLDHVHGGTPNQNQVHTNTGFSYGNLRLGVQADVVQNDSDYGTCVRGVIAAHGTPRDILSTCGLPPGSRPAPATVPAAPAPAQTRARPTRH